MYAKKVYRAYVTKVHVNDTFINSDNNSFEYSSNISLCLFACPSSLHSSLLLFSNPKKREIKTTFLETDAMAVVESGLSENEMIVENLKESKVKEGDLLYDRSSSNVDFNE